MQERKKTICIVMGSHFSAAIGGAQYQAKCLADALAKSGKYRVYYLTRKVDPNFKPKGYEIVQIAQPTGLRKLSFAFDFRRLLKLLGDIRPDVVYQRGLQPYTGIAAYYATRAKCRSVFHIASDHSMLDADMKGRGTESLLRRIEKRIENYGMRNVDSIIAQTKYQSMLLERKFGRRAEAVVANFHPLPNEEANKIDDVVKVVWVANFKSIKQPEIFVQLAEDLAYRNDLRFVMVGRPGNPSHFAELHERIRESNNIIYRGELSIGEVNQILAESHIFVNTSIAEGFPNTFIQAWMRRVPTLSLGVNPDGVFDSESVGFCADSYDMLRDKILELADNRSRIEAMGDLAWQHALQFHSPRNIGALVAILDSQSTDLKNAESRK